MIAEPLGGWTTLRDRLVDDLEARGQVLPQQLKVALGWPAHPISNFARSLMHEPADWRDWRRGLCRWRHYACRPHRRSGADEDVLRVAVAAGRPHSAAARQGSSEVAGMQLAATAHVPEQRRRAGTGKAGGRRGRPRSR